MFNDDSPGVVGYPSQSLQSVSKLWHVLNGLYIWEFFTTLDYEWSVIRGRRPYRWTIWIYSLTRAGTFVVTILLFISLDFMTPTVCQFVPMVYFTLAYLSFSAISLLIVLRIIAVWNKKKVISWFAVGLWLTNVAFLVQGVVRLRFAWMSTQICVVLSIESLKLTLIVTLITNIVLLLIVLAGLLRLRCPGGCPFALGRLLWNQGVLWLLLAIISEVPPVVLIILNINEALDLIFQIPSLIIMTIAASRMHRSLSEFAIGPTHIASSGFQTENPPISKTKQSPAVQITLPPMELLVQVAGEQYPASQSSLDVDINERQNDKPDGLAIDGGLESGMVERVACQWCR